jgi:hypothetical protein
MYSTALVANGENVKVSGTDASSEYRSTREIYSQAGLRTGVQLNKEWYK